ncbi:MAG: OstA-like protein, partial [Saprospiraceae bacterium]
MVYCHLYAQEKKEKIKLEQADELVYDQGFSKARRLRGNVIFSQGEMRMYCDSAYFYDEQNQIEAYENVRITKPDGAQLTGKYLNYNGDTRKAIVRQNVYMSDNQMTLTTEELHYDMATEAANYTAGATIVDKQNTLTSRVGLYNGKTKMLSFRDAVVLVNPRYKLLADTLLYNTLTHTAYFVGPTHINSTGADSTFIFCKNGWYNTDNDKSYFSNDAYIQSKRQKIVGDSLRYDKKKGLGEAYGNVMISDDDQKVLIGGNYASYSEVTQHSFVTGRSQLMQVMDNDTLFMHADTLYAIEDTATGNKSYFAYHHVVFFKSNMQGRCDSLSYSNTDTLLRMFNDPVLWTDSNQITADTIYLQLANERIDKLFMYDKSFIASQEDAERFNQIKGADMIGLFSDNELKQITVTGSGQTIYYARD